MQQKEFQDFLEAHLAKLKPISKELFLIQWEYDTTGNELLAEKKKQLDTD